MATFNIKKNDLVKVLSGKDRGKSGKVLGVFPKAGTALVEGINIRKRHRRPRRQGEKGQIVQFPSPIRISKVMLICPSCKKTTRPKKTKNDSGGKIRICRKCGSAIS